MKLFKHTNLKHLLILLSVGILLIQLLQILYFQREMFVNKYDISYWKDRVEHSRYYLPLSNRGIGDDAFYAYGGYKILQGEDPTKLIYDKPALGVALIGIASYLYNPAYSGLFFGIGTLILTYFIIYNLTKNALLGLSTVTFLLLDPLFFQNISTSLLDLPQLFFLLVNILCLQIWRDKKISYGVMVFISGLALGIFTQIKIPVIYPFVFIMEIFWLFRNDGKLIAVIFLLGNIVSIFLGYLPYLFHGYSIIEFLKIQKYILAFYKDSKLPLHMNAMWQFLFTGYLPGVVDGIPSKIAEWSFVYPIATITGIIFGTKALVKKKEVYMVKLFSVILLISLLIFTVIPSYPRYLIMILPFLYYFMLKAIFTSGIRIGSILVIILFVYSLVNTFLYFHPSPSTFLSYFYTNLSKQYFQDIYQEEADVHTKNNLTRDAFREIGQKAFSDAEIREMTIKENSYKYSIFDNKVQIPVVITYKTAYLGEFSETKYIEVIRENSQWKVKWQWNYLFNGFDTNTKIQSTRIVGKRGRIIDKNGKVLVEDSKGYLVSFNPKLMDGKQEKSMLALLSRLSYKSEVNLQNAYLENAPLTGYIPLFTNSKVLKQSVINELTSYKGIELKEYPTRIFSQLNPDMITNTLFGECCTRIYSSYNYHGNKSLPGPEEHYDRLLSGYDGGSLLISKDGAIKRIIVQKKEKNGQDVVLPK